MSKARTTSVRMGSWSSSTPHAHEDPVRRLTAARAAVERVRTEVHGALAHAAAAGRVGDDVLAFPPVNRALRCARQALRERAAAGQIQPAS
jgi:hypothetical protein